MICYAYFYEYTHIYIAFAILNPLQLTNFAVFYNKVELNKMPAERESMFLLQTFYPFFSSFSTTRDWGGKENLSVWNNRLKEVTPPIEKKVRRFVSERISLFFK